MCEYGFSDGTDFCSILSESTGGRPSTDHALTIEMAKELCMIQRNEKGKQARTYFIELEKQWNSPESVMARALKMADNKILALQSQNTNLQSKIEQDNPKVLFADSVATSKSSILVGELAKLICQNGYKIGEKRLFEWLRGKEYLISRRGSDRNMPTQKSVEMGLFETKITSIDHASGYTSEAKTPKVTGKGQTYFINKFLGLEGVEN
jgi:anti-repressor protein